TCMSSEDCNSGAIYYGGREEGNAACLHGPSEGRERWDKLFRISRLYRSNTGGIRSRVLAGLVRRPAASPRYGVSCVSTTCHALKDCLDSIEIEAGVNVRRGRADVLPGRIEPCPAPASAVPSPPPCSRWPSPPPPPPHRSAPVASALTATSRPTSRRASGRCSS